MSNDLPDRLAIKTMEVILATVTAERDQERKLARAAAEGHDHCRGLLLSIWDNSLGGGKLDDLDSIPAAEAR